MKLITYSLLLLLLLDFTPNDFEGGYVLESENKEGYYFWVDTNEFIWFRHQGGTWELGRGKFELKKDSLILRFGNARKQFDILEESTVVESGEELIHVTAIYSDKRPVKGLEVRLEKLGLRALSDENGIATLSTKGAKVRNDELHFQMEGYRTIDQTIEVKWHKYKFEVLFDSWRKYKENQTVRLQIEIMKKGIAISDESSRKAYRKVSRGRYLDLYHGFEE